MSNETTAIRSANPLTILLTHKLVIFVLRIFLGVMFLYSALHKVQHPEQFAAAVRAYQILPVALSNLFALAVGWSELVAGLMLIVGVFTRQAAAAALMLLVLFIAAIATLMIRGLVVDCGCFSSEGGSTTGAGLIVRNSFLAVATLMVMRFDRGFLSLSRWLPRPAEPPHSQ